MAKALSDAGVSEFLRQIQYKAAWGGVQVVRADRWFPSTKKCSGCGHKKDQVPLKERTYHCSECGLVLDRDLNAAMNLYLLAGGAPVTACGEDIRLVGSSEPGEQSSMKQELGIRYAG